MLVDLPTGHTTLNRHLTIMKIQTDPLCSACGEEKVTAYHFLVICSTRMLDIMSVFRSYLLELEELRKVNCIFLIQCVRTTKRF